MFQIIRIAIAIFFTLATFKNMKEGDNLNAVLCALIAATAIYFSV